MNARDKVDRQHGPIFGGGTDSGSEELAAAPESLVRATKAFTRVTARSRSARTQTRCLLAE